MSRGGKDEVSEVFKVKLNEPLHALGARMYLNHNNKIYRGGSPLCETHVTGCLGQIWHFEPIRSAHLHLNLLCILMLPNSFKLVAILYLGPRKGL